MAAQFGDWNSECQIVRLCTSYFWAAVAWFVRLCQVPLYTCLTHWFQLCLMIRLSWLGKGTVLYFKKPRCHLSPYLLSYKVGWKTKSWRHLRTPPVSLRTLLQDPQGAQHVLDNLDKHYSLFNSLFLSVAPSLARTEAGQGRALLTPKAKWPRFRWFFLICAILWRWLHGKLFSAAYTCLHTTLSTSSTPCFPPCKSPFLPFPLNFEVFPDLLFSAWGILEITFSLHWKL